MATERQISKLAASLVEHQSAFVGMPTEDAQWVIDNTTFAIALFKQAIKTRNAMPNPKVSDLFELVGDVTVNLSTKKFVARDHFHEDTNKNVKVKIYNLGINFSKWFLSKIEKPKAGKSSLRCYSLLRSSLDGSVITEFGGVTKAEAALAEVFALMCQQANGETGPLLNNGRANIFYVRDAKGVLCVVSVNWEVGGWCVDADQAESPFEWCDGCQFFSH